MLHDYFKGEKRAALASPDGAHLTPELVNALSGHIQLAQADGSAGAAKVIGHVTKLTGTATAIRNGVSIILNQGDNVHKGDVVQSGSDSTLGITFIDGSVFGLGQNARMVLNEMIYDPNGSNNSSTAQPGPGHHPPSSRAQPPSMATRGPTPRSRPWASAVPRCWSRNRLPGARPG